MRRAVWLTPIGGLALAVAWWQWRIEGSITDERIGYINYDLYSYYFPTVSFAFDELRRGRLPLWNPYQLAGEPFFANQQHGLLYPLNALFLILPAAAAFKWTAVVHFGLALGFAAFLGRTVGLSPGASALAAVAFTFGYVKGLLYSRTCLNAVVWLPIALAFALQIFRNPRRFAPVALLAAVCAVQYVGGYPMYSLFTGYALVFFAFWQSLELSARGEWRQITGANAALLGALLMATCVSAVQLLPMLEMTALSPRRLGGLMLVGERAFTTGGMAHYATLALPVPFPNARYLGAAVVVLAPFCLLHRRLRWLGAGFLILAVLSVVLASGPHTILYEVYSRLPTSNWFRFPGEFICLTGLGLAFAAGIGADALASHAPRKRRVVVAGIAVAAMVLAFFIRLYLPPAPFAWAGRRTSAILIAVAAPLILLTVAPRRWGWTVVIGALWLDLSLAFANPFIIPDTAADRFEPPPALVELLRSRQGLQRVYLHGPAFGPPFAKWGMSHRWFHVADHESLLPSRYAEYAAWMQGDRAPSRAIPPQGRILLDPHRKRSALVDLLGVRLVIGFPALPFANPAEAASYPLIHASPGVRVHENPRALPRAFVVGRSEMVPAGDVLARLSSPGFDPLQTALVEQPEAVVSGGGSRAAEILEYGPTRVAVRTSGEHPGLLVLTDQCYPGWLATVNGDPSPIFCADYIFRGVRVGKGEQVVVFEYSPTSLRVGMVISCLTVVAVVLSWALAIRSRAGRSRSAALAPG
jgi:hypothetical protein